MDKIKLIRFAHKLNEEQFKEVEFIFDKAKYSTITNIIKTVKMLGYIALLSTAFINIPYVWVIALIMVLVKPTADIVSSVIAAVKISKAGVAEQHKEALQEILKLR